MARDRAAEIDRIANTWTGEKCTLDGHEARVVGRWQKFATVAPYDEKIGEVEFAWETVDRIMRRDGKFKR